MRRTRWLLSTLFMAALLLPPAAAAQTPPVRIEPIPPPPPCTIGCWWPVGAVAQLDLFEANVEVTDGVMSAHYRLHLSNPAPFLPQRQLPFPAPAEARIVVPVPPGSSVVDLVLAGGPETLEGRLLDAGDAQRIYEEIVRRQIDPALLRSLGDDLYEVRAFPVPLGEERQVSFTVVTPLVADGDQALIELPWSRMSPRPAAALVDVAVDVPWEVRSALVPGFAADVVRNGPGRLSVSWESASGWTAGANFRLYLTGGEGLVDARLLAHRLPGENGYFALLFAPVVEVDAAVDRDVVLVLDSSGSMAGEKMEQAQAAASYVLERLGEGDRFAVVDFSRRVRVFGDGLHPASAVPAGLDYLDGLDARGGTNIAGALQRALELLSGERPSTVIFLTDGLPTVGIIEPDAILAVAMGVAPERAQLFAFGVGYEVDTLLLDALASRFAGTSHYVTPDERIDTEVQRLYERISTPVLTDVQIDIEGVATFDLAPNAIAGIFAGSQTLLTGRYEGAGPATVVVRGNAFDGEVVFEYAVSFPERDGSDPAIAQIWAQRRVADLITELRIEGARNSLIEEIVEVATRFGIVTPYTAYLAEEPELALRPQAAAESLLDAAATAPASGARAVDSAADVERLREGSFSLGSSVTRVVGAHSYYLLDGVWVRDGYDPAVAAPEVAVGSAAFAALMTAAPDVAAAAALGERVIVAGPDGWLTLVWPDAGGGAAITTPQLPPVVVGSPGGSSAGGGGGASAGPAGGASGEIEVDAGTTGSGGVAAGAVVAILAGVALTAVVVRRRRRTNAG